LLTLWFITFNINNREDMFLIKSDHSRPDNGMYSRERGYMDHNESIWKSARLMEAEANHAHNAATELEGLVLLLPSEKSRQLAQVQVMAFQTRPTKQ
jgi:hypothetical protein